MTITKISGGVTIMVDTVDVEQAILNHKNETQQVLSAVRGAVFAAFAKEDYGTLVNQLKKHGYNLLLCGVEDEINGKWQVNFSIRKSAVPEVVTA